MLGIKIGDEFLDTPGVQLELEQENPFLQFQNQIVGDFSLPFEVRTTPKNLRLLEYAGTLQKRVDPKGIECSVEDGGLQHSIGRLKVEKPEINLNATARGKISLYYLSGVASFFQDIKEVRVAHVDLGGVRSFPGTGYDPAGGGFWGHIHQVVNDPVGAHDYAFFPVVNKSWTSGKQTNEVMNHMRWANNRIEFLIKSTDGKASNAIVPFPYLHYVLKRVVAHVGWTITGEVFDDADFQKITLVNFMAIFHAVQTSATVVLGTNPIMLPTVAFDLRDHMPDLTVSEFLIALKNRFGWWYDFDRKTKTIRIKQLREVVTTMGEDLTHLATPVIPKKVEQRPRVYALKNEFVGEYANGAPYIKPDYHQGRVFLRADLPAATTARLGQTYLVTAENNFYICRESDTAGVYTWQFYAYNVYDVTPEGATDEITTKATTLGVEYYNPYLDLIPRMDAPGIWPTYTDSSATWGIHMVFYHGKRANKAGEPVPYASAHVYDSTGTQVAEWSLAFECQKADGTQVGLYHTAWAGILKLAAAAETFELGLYLTKAQFLQFRFSGAITIAGVKMFVQKMGSTIPYNGRVNVECIRI